MTTSSHGEYINICLKSTWTNFQKMKLNWWILSEIQLLSNNIKAYQIINLNGSRGHAVTSVGIPNTVTAKYNLAIVNQICFKFSEEDLNTLLCLCLYFIFKKVHVRNQDVTLWQTCRIHDVDLITSLIT